MKIKSFIVSMLLMACLSVAAQVKPVVAILGDSYSTFEGFVPEGHAVWYKKPANLDHTDVAKVEQTWWWQVVMDGGYKLGIVNSYSGATVCNTGYKGVDYTDRSFLTRATKLGNPDIILICGATNDSWANSPIGDYKYADWTGTDLYSFRPAMAKMLNDMQEHYPNVDIYFILNSELKDEINVSVEEICRHYNVPLVKLKDIDKKKGHPSVKGMKSFAQQVLKAMKKQ